MIETYEDFLQLTNDDIKKMSRTFFSKEENKKILSFVIRFNDEYTSIHHNKILEEEKQKTYYEHLYGKSN